MYTENITYGRPKVDLSAAVDGSGSMSGEPIRAVGKAVQDMVKKLHKSDRLSLYKFPGDKRREVGGVKTIYENESVSKVYQPLIADNFADAPGPYTNLYDAIDIAVQGIKARANHAKETYFFLVVLSDGNDNASKINVSEINKIVKVAASTIDNFNLVLMSAGAPTAMSGVGTGIRNTTEIKVDSNTARHVAEAFRQLDRVMAEVCMMRETANGRQTAKFRSIGTEAEVRNDLALGAQMQQLFGMTGGSFNRLCLTEGARPASKTRVCDYFNTPRGCTKGNACMFLHDRQAKPNKKNVPCLFWKEKGTCSKGNACLFKH